MLCGLKGSRIWPEAEPGRTSNLTCLVVERTELQAASVRRPAQLWLGFGNARLHDSSFAKRESHVLTGKRAPRWFTYFPVQDGQGLPHAPIAPRHRQARYDHSGLRRQSTCMPLGAETGRLIVTTVSQQRFGSWGQVERSDTKRAVASCNVQRVDPSGEIGVKYCKPPLNVRRRASSTIQAGLVDLRPTTAVTGKDNGTAVGRKVRLGVDARRARNTAHIRAAAGANDVNLRQTIAGQRHRQLAAIGRPRGRAVVARRSWPPECALVASVCTRPPACPTRNSRRPAASHRATSWAK